MYPCPMLHSYYQRCETETPRRALNRIIDQAMLKDTDCRDLEPPFLRLRSMHPQCYAPHVDVTRSKCAFGRQALPKLRKELRSGQPLVVRQAVNTIADLVHDPEDAAEAIRLQIPNRLANILVSDDPFLRERVAMIYLTIANQSNGGGTITQNPLIISNLVKSLNDRLACVRLKAAEVIEMLARDRKVAGELCVFGFIDLIVDRITYERRDTLVVILKTFKSLMEVDVKVYAIEIGMIEKLVMLLRRKDEDGLVLCLDCLQILCVEPAGKQKALDMDLLFTVQPFLEDERRSVHSKAAGIISFVTITTPGKLRGLSLQILGRLLELAADFHCKELQLLAFKALTNLAEVPRGRSMMLQSHVTFIDDIDTCKDEVVERHKDILLQTIRWQP